MISDGYNWTIVHMENREKYLDSLEQVTVEKDILPFVKFIENEMKN